MLVELICQTDGLKSEEVRDLVDYLDAMYVNDRVNLYSPANQLYWVKLRGTKELVDEMYRELLQYVQIHFPYALAKFQ